MNKKRKTRRRSKSSKGFDPIGFTAKQVALNMTIGAGTAAVGSLPAGPMKGSLMQSMQPLGMMANVHAMTGVIQMTGEVGRQVTPKKKRKRKR
jgi:hypothetical protein